jgi:hypothetical protein
MAVPLLEGRAVDVDPVSTPIASFKQCSGEFASDHRGTA